MGQEMMLQEDNHSLFDLLDLPEGIDKETLTDDIVMQGGEFEVLYSDPYFMRQAIGSWSKRHYRTFLKWISLLNMEYNPIENYDRMEEWTDKGKENLHQTGHSEDNITTDSSVNQDQSISTSDSGTTSGTTENKVSAFDSSTYQPSDQNITSGSSTNSGTTTGDTDTTSTSVTEGSTDRTDESHKGTESVHTGHMHGNIGTMTVQSMAQEEIELARFNIYDAITDLFLTEFCIMVYE